MTDKEVIQMALDALEKHIYEYEAVQALRTALAQPEPEPVAWLNKFKDAVSTDPYYRKDKDCTPLYTAPPQREWVGLTDEDEEQCRVKAAATYHRHKYSVRGQQISPTDNLEWHFVRAIEAKLKEKNSG